MNATKWHYSGDVNLAYGGSFIDLSTFADGYCTAVRVTDLDSACGFTGAVLIEHVVINGTDDPKRIRKAMKSCGPNDLQGFTKQAARHAIAEALMSYGFTDPDDNPYSGSADEVVQLEADGPMEFDGWKADKRLRNTTLAAYVESVHLSE